MAIVFCHRCQTARNMAESLTRWEAIDEDDNKTAMITRSYTCETCSTFVRSEMTNLHQLRRVKHRSLKNVMRVSLRRVKGRSGLVFEDGESFGSLCSCSL